MRNGREAPVVFQELDDKIHGRIELPDYVVQVIETPLFQRLKKVAQLGFVFKVIPEAKQSTRYDHSIGTCYLALKMLDALERNRYDNFNFLDELNDKEKEIYQKYRKCVLFAALLHDIGHGPFSHSWEVIFEDYHHEENGAQCIDFIFDDDILRNLFNNSLGVDCEEFVKVIKNMILGNDEDFPEKFRFLFQIVNNKKCLLDVDKIDYLKRDYIYAKKYGIVSDIDSLYEIFFNARISRDGSTIEYRYEDYEKIYNLFELRSNFHKFFYKDPKILAYEVVAKEILQRNRYEIDGKSLNKIKSSDTSIFLKLNDSKILQFLNSEKIWNALKYPDNIKEYHKEEALNGSCAKLIHVKSVIVGPGKYMPDDEKFSFYGKRENASTIKRDTNETIIDVKFKIILDN